MIIIACAFAQAQKRACFGVIDGVTMRLGMAGCWRFFFIGAGVTITGISGGSLRLRWAPQTIPWPVHNHPSNKDGATATGLTDLSDDQLDLVAGGAGTGGGFGGQGGGTGATLIGGRPPTLIITPNGRTIEPGTGPVVLVPKS